MAETLPEAKPEDVPSLAQTLHGSDSPWSAETVD